MTAQTTEPRPDLGPNPDIADVRTAGYTCYEDYYEQYPHREFWGPDGTLDRTNCIAADGTPWYVEPDGWSSPGDFD